MISIETKKKIRENWEKASKELNFRIISPYFIDFENNSLEIFGFLPDFGKNGTLIELTCEPDFEIDRTIVEFSKANNIFYSFLNVTSFEKYDIKYFKDVLSDWNNG